MVTLWLNHVSVILLIFSPGWFLMSAMVLFACLYFIYCPPVKHAIVSFVIHCKKQNQGLF